MVIRCRIVGVGGVDLVEELKVPGSASNEEVIDLVRDVVARVEAWRKILREGGFAESKFEPTRETAGGLPGGC